MKKWLFPALAALLLTMAVGCDQLDDLTIPEDLLPDTVDELTVVTTPETDESLNHPSVPDTTTETQPETQPEPETEVLSAEDASAFLSALLLDSGLNIFSPIEINMTGELKLTTQMYGFAGTTSIPLSAYYGYDAEGDLGLALAVPMVGTSFCTIADNRLYLYDGAESAVVCDLDEASMAEVLEVLRQQVCTAFPTVKPSDLPLPGELPFDMVIPGDWMTRLPDGWFERLPEEWLRNLPIGRSASPAAPVPPPTWNPDLPWSNNTDFKLFLSSALAGMPMDCVFRSIEAYRLAESGTTELILSGLSEQFISNLEAMQQLFEAVQDGKCQEQATKIRGIIALLKEQAEDMLTVRITVDTEGRVRTGSIELRLDTTSYPALTSNLPALVEFSLTSEMTQTDIDITAPADTHAYTEVELKDLLPALTPDAVPESAAKEQAD